MEDEKSLFERFSKASLITRNQKKKKFSKLLSVIKEFFQAFNLLVNKVIKLTVAFKYAITTLVPLAVTILNRSLYQPGKAGLRNHIINLSRSPSHEYPRNVKWMVDRLAAILSVPTRATNEEWLKTLVIFITPPAEA